jgi:hypothetical protein
VSEAGKTRLGRRTLVLGTIVAGLGLTASLPWWPRHNHTANATLRMEPINLVVDGPFKSGEFGCKDLSVSGLDENCPVVFKVCFEEQQGFCLAIVTLAKEKHRVPSRDINIACTVIGNSGMALGCKEHVTFPAKESRIELPGPYQSLHWRGREMIFELEGVTIDDIKRLELTIATT